jgi:hypothetical protein
MAGEMSGAVVPGDAAAAWCEAIAAAAGSCSDVALLSAPGWLEDVQVVAHLASRLRAMGLQAHLAQPGQLRWSGGRAFFAHRPLGAIVRFFQAEWIARLPRGEAWAPLFGGGWTPVSNPGTAVLAESKRLPLVWSELDAPATTWRRALPETRDPREAVDLLRGRGDWVLKPAFGNTGDDVALRATTSRRAWAWRAMAALAFPRRWVAQRRFRVVPLATPQGQVHPCIGVYVVDGRVAGAYGRVAVGPVVDYAAVDVAVLVEQEG